MVALAFPSVLDENSSLTYVLVSDPTGGGMNGGQGMSSQEQQYYRNMAVAAYTMPSPLHHQHHGGEHTCMYLLDDIVVHRGV